MSSAAEEQSTSHLRCSTSRPENVPLLRPRSQVCQCAAPRLLRCMVHCRLLVRHCYSLGRMRLGCAGRMLGCLHTNCSNHGGSPQDRIVPVTTRPRYATHSEVFVSTRLAIVLALETRQALFEPSTCQGALSHKRLFIHPFCPARAKHLVDREINASQGVVSIYCCVRSSTLLLGPTDSSLVSLELTDCAARLTVQGIKPGDVCLKERHHWHGMLGPMI
jgi:hypothetical protein